MARLEQFEPRLSHLKSKRRITEFPNLIKINSKPELTGKLNPIIPEER